MITTEEQNEKIADHLGADMIDLAGSILPFVAAPSNHVDPHIELSSNITGNRARTQSLDEADNPMRRTGLEYEQVNHTEEEAWNAELGDASLPEVHGSVAVHVGGNVPWWRTLAAFIGPGVMIAVGYMDPGNWSTDIAGGSAFGYSLLFVVLLSSLIAIFLQALAVKVGIATNRDLAQACRDSYPLWLVTFLWIVMEAAIIATDLAEVIGSAIALNLLFKCPLVAGVCVTAVDVLFLMFFVGKSVRILEGLVASLVLLITIVFAIQIGMSHPETYAVMNGFLPSAGIIENSTMALIAAGIIGATIMPHNLFLHSSMVLTREINRERPEDVKMAFRCAIVDSTASLICALFVNSAILITAASVFYRNGYHDVATLQDAYLLLDPLLGSTAASTLFAVALLASSQNSTLTGTLAGQIVMEGFMRWQLRPFVRRLVTRLMAIIPAVIAVIIGGAAAANHLLIYSQVVLSFALPFAIFPLVHISSNKAKMGDFANGWAVMILAYITGFLIFVLNIFVLI